MKQFKISLFIFLVGSIFLEIFCQADVHLGNQRGMTIFEIFVSSFCFGLAYLCGAILEKSKLFGAVAFMLMANNMLAQQSYPNASINGSYPPQVFSPAPYEQNHSKTLDTTQWPTIGDDEGLVMGFLNTLEENESWDEVEDANIGKYYVAYTKDVRLNFYMDGETVGAVLFFFNIGREDLCQGIIETMKVRNFMVNDKGDVWTGENRNGIAMVVQYIQKDRMFFFMRTVIPKPVQKPRTIKG